MSQKPQDKKVRKGKGKEQHAGSIIDKIKKEN